jgi:hypothetical protein
MSDPSAYLTAPSTPDETMTNGFVNPVDLFNYVSPSAWINAGIEQATGVDVFGYFTDAVTGEWDAIWKFGDAMGHLADCLQDLGINIQQCAIDLDVEWDGNSHPLTRRTLPWWSRLVNARMARPTRLGGGRAGAVSLVACGPQGRRGV